MLLVALLTCFAAACGTAETKTQETETETIQVIYENITAEAAKAVINYLFFEVGVHRVEIHHATDNPASGRVAEKCGLTCEGVLRSRSKTGTGEFKDIRVWGILREEWKTED